MKLLALLLWAALSSFVAAQPDHEPLPECGECRPEECGPQVGCIAGMVKDRCGCCEICGNREGMLCDREGLVKIDRRYYKYGKCGTDLVCKAHPEHTPEDPLTVCYCQHTDVVCGTNGQTYQNLCQVTADMYRFGKDISVLHKGPCPSAPLLDTPPDSHHNFTGDKITLTCEATGYPSPSFEWHRITEEEEEGPVVLPGDDRNVVVQSRGGPDKHQVTGWLQIEPFTRSHQGEYSCTVKNKYGSKQAIAVITVGDNFVDEEDDRDEDEDPGNEIIPPEGSGDDDDDNESWMI